MSPKGVYQVYHVFHVYHVCKTMRPSGSPRHVDLEDLGDLTDVFG